jgi:hypothetical protein
MQHPEHEIQKQIVQYLRARGLVVFSVPGEAAGSGHAAMLRTSRMKAAGLLPGVSDLVLVLPGRVLFLEVKSKTGRQAESQKMFKGIVEALGHSYALVRSVDDVKAQIKMQGLA